MSLFPADSVVDSPLTRCLDSFRLSQLENLAVDRHAFKAFVKKINVVQEFMKLREDVMTGNIQIAEKTLSYEERMRALQAEVQQLRTSLRLSQQSLAEKQSRQQRVTAVRVTSLDTRIRTPQLIGLFCSAVDQMH